MKSEENSVSILIMSDTHGLIKEIDQVVTRHQTDYVIHCGDSELAYSRLSHFESVGGNCDYDTDYPQERVLDINDQRIFVTHGHLYNVKSHLTQLSYRAEELEADIICFGHTHVAGSLREGNQLFINPGSLKQARHYPDSTYAILRLANEIVVDFYTLEGLQVSKLSKVYKK